jgi:PelA/Pel-15E family pectate lyase
MKLRHALPFVALLTVAAGTEPMTIHLAGDSTMAQKTAQRRPETGWGEALPQYFPEADVRVENHAKGGRSTRTFIEEGRWQQLMARVRSGDYVVIQFGHNDEVPSKTDRYTPPERFRANLERFVNDVRAARATPILMTPVARRKFGPDGKAAETHAEYSAIVREVAARERVAFIDMDRKSQALLTRYGAAQSRKLFLQLKPGEHPNFPDGIEDNTHFSPAGAEAMAELAIEGFRELQLSFVKHLRNPDAVAALRSSISRNAAEELLAPARIARLPAAQRAAWQRYIAVSDSIARSDSIVIASELRAIGMDSLLPAPTGSGFFVTDEMTPDWFGGAEAEALAQAIATYQAPNGGWSKRIDFSRPRAAGQSFTSAGNSNWLSTLDNGATTEQLRFLEQRLKAKPASAHSRAYTRGLEYLLNAQFPNGCWPQIYPLAGRYHDAITFNDDATVSALRVLQSASRSQAVTTRLRTRAGAAVNRGVECILTTQVLINGIPAVWGAQHDPLTMEPIKARAYEHASLSGRESASILNFLISIENPSPEIKRAVHAGAAWFRSNAVHGYTYAIKAALTPKRDAEPIWARFYELGTNRPIFSDRDGVVRYNLNEIGEERRSGYMWYTDEPATMIRRYDRWARQHRN